MDTHIDHLIVDDLREPTGDMWKDKAVHVVKTSDEALAWLEAHPNHALYTVCFDHDLGIVDGVEDTAVPVARYLEKRAINGDAHPIRQVYVHTSNHTDGGGSWEIESALKKHYPVQVVDSNVLGLTYP